MKLLSDYRNEEALDLLVEILEPASEMMADQKVIEMLYEKGKRMEGVKLMIANHKSAVIKILAALDGCDPAEYECGFFTLPTRLIEILNDKELLTFFTEQQNQSSSKRSGSATESTEAHAE